MNALRGHGWGYRHIWTVAPRTETTPDETLAEIEAAAAHRDLTIVSGTR
ncbi:hypothetical protein [Actinomadura sp. 9N407]